MLRRGSRLPAPAILMLLVSSGIARAVPGSGSAPVPAPVAAASAEYEVADDRIRMLVNHDGDGKADASPKSPKNSLAARCATWSRGCRA
ncbi:MAG: hypothetical protein ACR2IT_03185 [Pirellulales bacterium]